MLHGTPASEGIGLGRVMIVEEAKLEYNNVTVTDTEAEVERFRNAVKIYCDNTAAQADALKASAGKKEAEILEGHIQMMKDPYMCGEIEKLIDNGQCAEAALEYMCDMFISQRILSQKITHRQYCWVTLTIKKPPYRTAFLYDQVADVPRLWHEPLTDCKQSAARS